MCTSHLEDWSSLLTEQCGDGKEDLEAMWRCSSSVQCAEIVFVSGSGERVGAIGMAFSDHMLVISFQPCDLSLHGPCL